MSGERMLSVMWTRRIKICGSIALTLILILAGSFSIGYLVNDDTKSYTRITLHELYDQKWIDSIFIGASHVYRSIDSAVIDEIWEENTFNCSTSSQNINGSYALLKEAHKTGGVRKCYLELSIGSVWIDRETRRKNVVSTYIISDYMKPSLNKLEYILGAFEPEGYINGFSAARRNWRYIYSVSFLKNTVKKKSQDTYKNYAYVKNETEAYAGKGFVYSTQVPGPYVSDKEIRQITDQYMSDDYRHYFEKIVAYCQRNDIELVCFSVPVSEYLIEQVGDYDNFYQQMLRVCEQYDISYYDFNLAKTSILNFQEDEFQDMNHLNGKGAEKFSRVFADFFAGNIREEDLFYPSYSEKKKELPEKFLGLHLEYKDEKKEYEIEPISTKKEKYEYEAYYTDSNGKKILLHEKSSDARLKFPEETEIPLTIQVYDSKGNEIWSVEKFYRSENL